VPELEHAPALDLSGRQGQRDVLAARLSADAPDVDGAARAAALLELPSIAAVPSRPLHGLEVVLEQAEEHARAERTTRAACVIERCVARRVGRLDAEEVTRPPGEA